MALCPCNSVFTDKLLLNWFFPKVWPSNQSAKPRNQRIIFLMFWCSFHVTCKYAQSVLPFSWEKVHQNDVKNIICDSGIKSMKPYLDPCWSLLITNLLAGSVQGSLSWNPRPGLSLSFQVNTTSRQGIKQLGSFGICFAMKVPGGHVYSSQGKSWPPPLNDSPAWTCLKIANWFARGQLVFLTSLSLS